MNAAAWLPFALLGVASLSANEVLVKRAVQEVDEVVIAFVENAATVAAACILLLFVPAERISHVPSLGFWVAALLAAALGGAGDVLFNRGYRFADLSRGAPARSLSPIVTWFAAVVLLGERPGALALAGVFGTALAVGLLSVPSGRPNGTAALPPFFKDRGVRLMLLVSALWALPPVFAKLGLERGSSLAFLIATLGLTAVLLAWPAIRRWPRAVTRGGLLATAGTTVTAAGMMIASIFALARGPAALVIAFMGASTLVTVLTGVLVLHEPQPGRRIAAAVLLVAALAAVVCGG